MIAHGWKGRQRHREHKKNIKGLHRKYKAGLDAKQKEKELESWLRSFDGMEILVEDYGGDIPLWEKIMDKQMEQEGIPFTSWAISESCQKIADSIDVLEQSIMKKPYYGMMIKYFSNSANEPIDDIMSISTYEYEKRRLDKKLKKQMELSEK